MAIEQEEGSGEVSVKGRGSGWQGDIAGVVGVVTGEEPGGSAAGG